MSFIELSKLIDQEPDLQLTVAAGEVGLDRHLVTIDVNRPGLALAGFFKNFASDRIQVFGKGEHSYLQDCATEDLRRIGAEFFHYKFPALVFTHGNEPPEFFHEMAAKTGTPLLKTVLSTHNFIVHFTRVMTEELAPSTSIHGVLVEVFGVGILLMGASGIGKSETALELVERGHRLVADDIIIVKCINNTSLYGQASQIIQHSMELRGLGIINVKDLFGVGALRGRKRIELVILIEDWDPKKEYERLGLEDQTVDILGVRVQRLLVPVRPGRNIPILVETAAMNYRSKAMGYHAARELRDRINARIKTRKTPGTENT
ncbi:MAG: HPr kinase/phosphorylase [Spirochaetia bacterium]|nr:HPr kinase/phosphorylase [Spirochaetia bacterium]